MDEPSESGRISQQILVKSANDNDEKESQSMLLADVVKELRTMNQSIAKLESNTRDGIKEMVWYKRRPDHVDLFVRVSFVSIGDIDAVKQEFQCEFYLNVTWKEPQLMGKASNDEVDWENIWEPGVYFVDAVNYDIFERNQQLRVSPIADEPPNVVQYFHIKGTFKEVLEVNKFPFDYQDLTLVLTANWDVNAISLKKDPTRDDNIRTWNFTARQEWDLQKHVLTESAYTVPEEGSSPNVFPLYKIRIHVKRQYGFYIYNVALIMCLITALTFSAFAVGVDSVGDRIQITLTLLLTSVAFKYYVQQFVPTVSYLTLMDKYVLFCMGFQFIMAIHNSLSGMVPKGTTLDYFEWGFFGATLGIFVIIHIIFGILSLVYVFQAKREMRMHQNQYKEVCRLTKECQEQAAKKIES